MTKRTRLNYTEWKDAIDALLIKFCGIDSDCLPDMPYRRWYDAHYSPTRVIPMIIKRAKDY